MTLYSLIYERLSGVLDSSSDNEERSILKLAVFGYFCCLCMHYFWSIFGQLYKVLTGYDSVQ